MSLASRAVALLQKQYQVIFNRMRQGQWSAEYGALLAMLKHSVQGFAGGKSVRVVTPLENLEPRTLMSSYTISGASSVDEGSLYVLNLGHGNAAVESWSVDWGDGQVQSVQGSLTSITHVYADGLNTFEIQAWAFDGTESHKADFGSAPPLAELTSGTNGVTTTLVGEDDSIDSINIGNNTFRIGGTTYTGSNLFVSSNGLLTFGSSNSQYNHTDMTDLQQASVAALWRDWVTYNEDNGVYYKLHDSNQDGQPDYLVIQWNLTPIDDIGEGSAIFQVILELNTTNQDGNILLNYISVPRDYFDGGTVGIKKNGSDSQSINLISYNGSGDWGSDYVVTSKVIGPSFSSVLTVNDVPPALSLSGSSLVNNGDIYTLTLGSVIDPGADVVSQYRIAWGDGEITTLNASDLPVNRQITHVYAVGTRQGTARIIQVGLTNEEGTFSNIASLPITVYGIAPQLNVTGDSIVQQGVAYTLNLSSGDPNTDGISSWSINWGDGSDPDGDGIVGQVINSSITTIQHTYAIGGSAYNIQVAATNSDGVFAASPVNIRVTTGLITREVWTNISGGSVSDLVANANYPNAPQSKETLGQFESPVNWAENFGERVRGYITVPTTGDYTFWIASDDSSQLYLSLDESPDHKQLIAYLSGATGNEQWDGNPSQKSVLIHLEAGQRYYIEALHKEGSGGDNLSVAWQGPGFTRQVIAGQYLDPIVSTVVPTAPSNLVAISWSNKVDLTWTDNTVEESGYIVERSTDGEDFDTVATLGANATAFEDLSVQAETSYYYRVRAINTVGTSAPSEAVLTMATDKRYWKAGHSGSWNDVNNWMNGRIPDATNDVIINASGANTITISSGDWTIRSLILTSNNTLVLSGGNLSFSQAVTLNGTLNLSGGTLAGDFITTGDTYWSGTTINNGSIWTNAGIVSITGASKNTSGFTFNNSGLVDVQQGDFTINGSGSGSGIYRTEYSANLVFNSSKYTLMTGAVLEGLHSVQSTSEQGYIKLIGGTLITAGEVTGSGFWQSGGMLSRTGTGYLALNNTTGTNKWTGGMLGGILEGVLNVAASGSLEISGGVSIRSGQLNNYGTVSKIDGGNINLIYGGVINNKSGAIFEVTPMNCSIVNDTQNGTVSAFNNDGVLRVLGNSGFFNINVEFNNTGTVEVEQGNISFYGKTSNSGVIETKDGLVSLYGITTNTGHLQTYGSGNIYVNGLPWMELPKNGSPVSLVGIPEYAFDDYADCNNHQYYGTAIDGGFAIWKIADDTAYGAVCIASFYTGTTYRPDQLTSFSKYTFYFRVKTDTGYALWKSDGTTIGTQKVKDFSSNYKGYTIDSFTSYTVGSGEHSRQFLYFRYGSSLYRSDGTEEGTQLVWSPGYDLAEEAPGALIPKQLTRVNGQLRFLYANTLYAIDDDNVSRILLMGVMGYPEEFYTQYSVLSIYGECVLIDLRGVNALVAISISNVQEFDDEHLLSSITTSVSDTKYSYFSESIWAYNGEGPHISGPSSIVAITGYRDIFCINNEVFIAIGYGPELYAVSPTEFDGIDNYVVASGSFDYPVLENGILYSRDPYMRWIGQYTTNVSPGIPSEVIQLPSGVSSLVELNRLLNIDPDVYGSGYSLYYLGKSNDYDDYYSLWQVILDIDLGFDSPKYVFKLPSIELSETTELKVIGDDLYLVGAVNGQDGIFRLNKAIASIVQESVVEGSINQLNANTFQNLTTSSVDDPYLLAPWSYEWDLDGDGIFGETGTDAERGNEAANGSNIETGAQVAFSATGLSAGETYRVALKVTAYDGSVAFSYIDLKVVNAPPSVTVLEPENVFRYQPSILQASVTDHGFAATIDTVEFFVDGESIGFGTSTDQDQATSHWTISWTPTKAGDHLIHAVATDKGSLSDTPKSGTSNKVHVNVVPLSTISGTVFHDTNRNAAWDRSIIAGPNPEIIFVVDHSGSTWNDFAGTPVGDLNGDGISNTILDAEIAGLSTLTNQIISQGYGDTARITIIQFDDTVQQVGISMYAGQDLDHNGILDIIQVLRSIQLGGGTEFVGPIEQTIDLFQDWNTQPGNANLFFLSDGSSSSSNDEIKYWADELRRTYQVNVRAIGIGGNADLTQLSIIDPRAFIVTSTDELNNVFNDSSIQIDAEGGLANTRVYIDLNNNGSFDEGEYTALTDSNGHYEITLVPPGTYTVRVDLSSEWVQTTALIDHHITANGDPVYQVSDFGYAFGTTPPSADFSENLTVNERSPVTIEFFNPQGISDKFLYSFDINGNGSFDGPGDVYKSNISSITTTFDDGPRTYTVHARIYDSEGLYRDYTVNVHVQNVAPTVSILYAPDKIDVSQLGVGANAGITLLASANDLSSADRQSGFSYLWTCQLQGSTEDPISADQKAFQFNPTQAGIYTITLQVTDKDGGVGTATKTIVVTDVSPHIISGPVASSSVVTGTTVQLSLVAVDDLGLGNLVYQWGWISGPDHDVGISDNGTNTANQVTLTFTGVGTYQFAVAVIDSEGNEVVSQPVTIEVIAAATTIDLSPPLAVLAPTFDGSTAHTLELEAKIYDQFGNAYTPVANESINWLFAQNGNASGGSVVSESNTEPGVYHALYTSGSVEGIDTITISVGNNTASATAAIRVNSAVNQIIGAASQGISAKEGVLATNLSLAGFVDPDGNYSKDDYEATIVWGDGSSSAGVIGDYTLPNGTHAYEVKGSHTFAEPGTMSFTVIFRHTVSGRSYSVEGTIVVADTSLVGSAANLSTAVGRGYSGAVALFTDENPVSVASDFSAMIDWGNGVTSNGQITKNADGTFTVSVSEGDSPVFTSVGTSAWSLVISKNGSSKLTLKGSIRVSQNIVPVPTGLNAVSISSSQIYLDWEMDINASGYVIVMTDLVTGVQSGANSYIKPGHVYQGNPDKYSYVAQNLLSGHMYSFAIQSVYQDGSISAATPPVTATTWSTVNVPIPAHMTGQQTYDSETGATGVQLSWDVSDVDGYKVFRWNGTDWIDIVDTNQNGQEDYIDPASATNGRVSWFDSDADFNGPTNYKYKIVAYKRDTGRVDPVAAEAPIMTVGQDNIPPQVPQNVQVASYPQGIQLTWNDRSAGDNADWAGWNVYRLDSAGNRIKLNAGPIVDTTGFDDYSAPIGQISTYEITAVDVFGNESDAAVVTKRRSIHGEPGPITGLIARPDGQGKIQLTWDAATPVQDAGWAGDALRGYNVYRYNEATQTWDKISSETPIGTPSFTDEDLSNSTEYQYRVEVVDLDNDTSVPVSVTVRTGNGIAPAAPENLVATTIDTTSLHLTWSAGTGGGDATTAYRIYRSTRADSGFVLVNEVQAGQTNSLDDLDLAVGTTWYYRIFAVDADGDLSLTAATVWQSTQNVPEQAAYLSITNLGITSGNNALLIDANTTVRGIVDDPNNNLQNWQLVLRPISATGVTGDSGDIIIGQGINEVGQHGGIDGALGIIQPTLLANGLYQLVLKSSDPGNTQQEFTGAVIEIKTNVKTGSFKLPASDLQVNVPGGSPIVANRNYDSANASVLGDFGYGWNLDLNDTSLRTTARAGTYGDASLPALRSGDIIYINVPGLGQQAFAFMPVPLNYNSGSLANGFNVYVTYRAQFIAVDGSGSTLTAGTSGDSLTLLRVGDEFIIEGDNGRVGYNPALPEFGGIYTLTLQDGTIYTINASNGQLTTKVDASGNTTDYSVGGAQSANTSITVHRNADGLIDWISSDSSGATRISYLYDDNKNLIAVTDLTGHTTHYHYDDPDHPHFLTSVTDARGITTQTIVYDAKGVVAAVKDAEGNTAPLSSSGLNGSMGSNAAMDTDGNITENIYDQRGNIIREIKQMRDPATGLPKYIVTVHSFSYVESNLVDPLSSGISTINQIISQTDYQSFVIEGWDNTGLRYTQSPIVKSQEITYYYKNDPNDGVALSDVGNVRSQAIWSADGTVLTTTFSNYIKGKAGTIIDPYGNITVNTYDTFGNLTSTTTQAETASAETTYYCYTNGGSYTYIDGTTVNYSSVAKGLLL